jgi:hypothetical protein
VVIGGLFWQFPFFYVYLYKVYNMKVYTVIAKYNGYDEYPDKYIGTFDSLESVIENHGFDLYHINKVWGGINEYISWLNNTEKDYQTKHLFNGHVCYTIFGRGIEWGYQLYVYETELIGKFEHKFI